MKKPPRPKPKRRGRAPAGSDRDRRQHSTIRRPPRPGAVATLLQRTTAERDTLVILMMPVLIVGLSLGMMQSARRSAPIVPLMERPIARVPAGLPSPRPAVQPEAELIAKRPSETFAAADRMPPPPPRVEFHDVIESGGGQTALLREPDAIARLAPDAPAEQDPMSEAAAGSANLEIPRVRAAEPESQPFDERTIFPAATEPADRQPPSGITVQKPQVETAAPDPQSMRGEFEPASSTVSQPLDMEPTADKPADVAMAADAPVAAPPTSLPAPPVQPDTMVVAGLIDAVPRPDAPPRAHEPGVAPDLLPAASGDGVCKPRHVESRLIPGAFDATDFGKRLASAAEAQMDDLVVYTAGYRRIGFPMGDLPRFYGACTDLVIRAYRSLGVDLQDLVHRSRLGRDASIDHRRTEVLRRLFARDGETLPVSEFPEDYQPGDIVTYYRPFSRVSRAHIAIVSNVLAPSGRPMIVHNRGWGPQLEDALFADRITGHYRFTGVPRSLAVAEMPPAPAHASRPLANAAFKPSSIAAPASRRTTTAADVGEKPGL